jgi:hypothetical protein
MRSTRLRGGPEAAELLRRWGVHADSLTAFAVASRSRAIDAERLAIRWIDEIGAAHVLSVSQGRVLGFIGDDGAAELAKIVDGLAGEARMPLRIARRSPRASGASRNSPGSPCRTRTTAPRRGWPSVRCRITREVGNSNLGPA